MSQADRTRWNKRYREGAYQERTQASVIVQDWVSKPLQNSLALDLACGSGRNALYLSQLGFVVNAVDISNIALDRARANQTNNTNKIEWLEHDLEYGLPPTLKHIEYDLIILIRYVDLDLLEELTKQLRPGGKLLIEEHLRWNYSDLVVGPQNSRYRVAPGDLRESVGNLEIVKYFEGLIAEPDGAAAAVARLLGRRPQTS